MKINELGNRGEGGTVAFIVFIEAPVARENTLRVTLHEHFSMISPEVKCSLNSLTLSVF